MKLNTLLASAPMMLFCVSVLGAPAKLSPADEAAAFKAAGFKLKGKQWRGCDDPSPSSNKGVGGWPDIQVGGPGSSPTRISTSS